jgi:hypothetical protein
VHAGAVGSPSGGVLLAGKGGAGKSTTVAACLRAGLGVAGDDLVLVELGERPAVHSLLETLKLEPAALALLPELGAYATGTESLPCAKHVVWTRRVAKTALLASFPLRAVLVPAIVARPTSQLLPMPAAEALRSLAPSTLQLLPGGEAEAFAKMAALLRQLPCFRLEAGSDLTQLPRLIRALLGKLS